MTTTRDTWGAADIGSAAGGRGTVPAQTPLHHSGTGDVIKPEGGAVPTQTAVHHRDWLRIATTGSSGRLQWLRQVHRNRCIRATGDSCATTPEADAAWTEEAGLGLVIQTADCVPITITDESGDKIGAAHAGWRGLVSGVIEGLVESMGNAVPLMAWIGPAIGVDAYEVGPDVHEAVCSAYGTALAKEVFHPGARKDKWQLDLYALAARLLAEAGVTEVHGERLCTHSDPRFDSYRRDGVTGGMATVVWKAPRGK